MSEFVEYVRETLEPFGDVRVRRMFGGYGIYRDDLMFALVSGDVLYLKADQESAPAFLDRGLAPFHYVRQGKQTSLSYFSAPEEIFDDPDEAVNWATRAFEAAMRARSR